MTIASASKTRVARVAEASFGVTPTTPTFLEMRRISGNMRTQKTTVVSDEIHLDRAVRGEYQTGQDPDGSDGFELAYGSFDDLFAASLFGAWTNNLLVHGTTGQSLTFEGTIDTGGGTYASSRFAGCAVSSLALTIASRAAVKGTLSLMGSARCRCGGPDGHDRQRPGGSTPLRHRRGSRGAAKREASRAALTMARRGVTLSQVQAHVGSRIGAPALPRRHDGPPEGGLYRCAIS